MYEEDHAPVTLSETYHRVVLFRLGKSGRTSTRWLLKSLRAARARWTVVSLLAGGGSRFEPDATRHRVRTVLLNV